MRHRDGLLALVGWLGLCGAMQADEPTIPVLAENLASPRYAVREAACRSLLRIGEPALPALRQQLMSGDREAILRAEQLIRDIQQNALQTRLLRSPLVRFRFHDTPVPQVIHEITTRTGLDLQLQPTPPASTRLSIDTGEVPVWEAIDKLLAAAEWSESFQPQSPNPQREGESGYRAYAPETALQRVGNRLIVRPGKQQFLPTDASGPLRVRALPPDFPGSQRSRGDNRITLMLDVTPIPQLQWQGTQEVRIHSARDVNGRYLEPIPVIETPAADPLYGDIIWQVRGQPIQIWSEVDALTPVPSEANPRHRAVSLRYSQVESKTLAELRGSVVGRALAPPSVALTIPDIMAASKSATYRGEGAAVQLRDVQIGADGRVDVKITLHTTIDPRSLDRPMQEQAVRVRGRAMLFLRTDTVRVEESSAPRLELHDGTGQLIPIVTEEIQQQQQTGSTVSEERLLRFQRNQHQSEPKELRLIARPSITIEAPFVLKNVPLP